MSISLAEVLDPNQLVIPRRLKAPSFSLLTEQQKPGPKKPYLKAEVYPNFANTRRLAWERLYSGLEVPQLPALAFDGQGSLYRGRWPGAAANQVFRQRVPSPAPGSDFSSWTLFGNTTHGFALCALEAEIVYFFFNSGVANRLYQCLSTNYGSSWTTSQVSIEIPRYAVNYLAADFKPNGDILIANANYHATATGRAVINVKKRTGGAWAALTQIFEVTALTDIHTGIAVVYDGDWNILFTIRRSGICYLYKIIHGDGYRLPVGSTSAIEEVLQVPEAQGFVLQYPFLTTLPGDKRPSFLMSFAEKYTGTEAIARPYLSHGLKDHDFLETLFREPTPFNLTSEFGLALARSGDYAWAASAEGVWRASIASQPLDISKDIVALNETVSPFSGKLSIELNNSKGTYNNPGTGNLIALNRGSEVRPGLGLKLPASSEAIVGDSYWIESLEHRTAPNERTFVITCDNAWGLLRRWTPRHTLRWTTLSVYKVLQAILGKVGIPLNIISCSPAILGFIPDFTVSPGDNGLATVQRLLSFVPDVIIFSRGKGYLINPTPGDIPVYEYSKSKHPVIQGNYAVDTPEVTRVQVIGRTGTTDIVVDGFNWDEITLVGDRYDIEPDLNITTIAQARDRAAAILRDQLKDRARITTLPNFALELFDPIEVTDLIAPVSKAKYRVSRAELTYDTRLSRYDHELNLTGV